MPVPLIRTSERGDFKSCQFLWYHHWVRGLSSPRVPTWSWFGTAWHRAMEARYPVGLKRGSLGHITEVFVDACEGEQRRVYQQGGELDDEEYHDGVELGKAMLTAYVHHYGADSRWEVLHTEQPFQIDVRHPQTDRLIAVYCGTWDLFVWDRIDKVYRLVDHKTRASFKKEWTFFNLNDQAGSYLWVAREVLMHLGLLDVKDVIDGIVFNMARKAMPQPTAEDGIRYNLPKKLHYLEALKPHIGAGSLAKMKLVDMAKEAADLKLDVKGDPRAVQPAPNFERYTTRREPEQRVKQGLKVIDEARHMDLVRRGKLPILKHPTEDCVRCSLFDLCQLDEQDPAEAEAYAATMLVQRDPYADHREAMQEDNGFIVSGS